MICSAFPMILSWAESSLVFEIRVSTFTQLYFGKSIVDCHYWLSVLDQAWSAAIV